MTWTVSSRLAAAPDAVWAAVTSLAGINAELWPWVRMTRPPGAEDGLERTGDLGRSWILLGGLVPIDADDLHLEHIEPGRGFRERSTLLSARRWHHDRSLEPLAGGGTRVVDRVLFDPRVRALGQVQGPVFALVFRWRHRRLRRRFGSAA